MGEWPRSRALYRVDFALPQPTEDEEFSPKILGVGFAPDLKNIINSHPEFVNDVFQVLFMGTTIPDSIVKLPTWWVYGIQPTFFGLEEAEPSLKGCGQYRRFCLIQADKYTGNVEVQDISVSIWELQDHFVSDVLRVQWSHTRYWFLWVPGVALWRIHGLLSLAKAFNYSISEMGVDINWSMWSIWGVRTSRSRSNAIQCHAGSPDQHNKLCDN